MNLLEKSIERGERRIKRIKENPDPTKLRSNLLGYELELNRYKVLLEAWRQGRPIICIFPSQTLVRAVGFEPLVYPQFVARSLAQAPRYRQIIRSMGLPEHLCDYMILGLAMAIAGDVPPPSFVAVANGECTVSGYTQRALAEHFGVPYFEWDCPLEYNEENIRYVADQLGNLIEFAESRVPGIKYDQDKHLELLEAERIAFSYCREEWELRKHVPFPLTNRESFSQVVDYMPSSVSEPAKALEYWRQRTEEIQERAARGAGREERMRVLWSWGAPIYMDPFAVLESRKVTVPHVFSGLTGRYYGRRAILGDEKEFGRKLSPLEEEARAILGGGFRQLGRVWVEDIIWACQQLGCDAIINYQFIGCIPTASLGKMVADTAERELGIPTFIISGSPTDQSSLPPAEFEFRLAEFIDMVLASKGRS
jgi:hypothetical protein